MKNALVSVRFTLDLPESVVADIAGHLDDGTDAGREEALLLLETYMADEFHQYLDYISGGAVDVEADA